MDVHYELNGALFVWNERKARSNVRKHEVTFERAAEAFFDPLFNLVDAGNDGEARNAVIGYDARGRLLFVVHIQFEDDHIRIISARKATAQERNNHDS